MAKKENASKSAPDFGTTQKLLLDKSFQKLLEYFDADEPDIDSARMALKVSELITKREGTELHREVLVFGIMQAIHTEPEDLARAAAAYRPDLKSLKKLTA